MKYLPLSLLSRGCGQLVPLRDGGHDGRLEVCFEPEDYFSWRAQPLLLRLSRSGRLLGGGVEDPVPPKTYTTRKGHLILYSEDLVSSSSQSAANRKGLGSKQEADPPLHTLRDLTGAILAYRRKQPREAHGTGEVHPLFCHLKHPSHTHLSSTRQPPWDRLSQRTDRLDEGVSGGRPPPAPLPPVAPPPYRPRFLCSPRPIHAPSEPLPPITEGLLSQRGHGCANQQKDTGVTQETGGFQCPMTSTDVGETHNGTQSEADTPNSPMILCHSPEPESQQDAEGQHAEETHESALLCGAGCAEDASDHGKCCLKRASVDTSWRSSRLSHINFYGGHMAGGQRINSSQYTLLGRMGLRGRSEGGVTSDPSFSILHLPPLPRNPLVSSGTDGHAPQRHDGSSRTLPPIPEGASLTKTHTPEIPAQRPDTPVPDLTHTQSRTKMANSTGIAAVRASHAPGRILLLIPRATREEEAERSGGVTHGIHPEEKVKERNTREKDRGIAEEVAEGEEERDKELREEKKRKWDDTNANEGCGHGECGELGPRPQGQQAQREQQELGLETDTFTLVGFNHQHLILMETQDGAALPPSLGALPPLIGRRGPGKQSSMAAYRQNPPDPPEPGQSQPSIVRGSIPVELRDWQKGGGWGTLIMGPDGDIIRLSLWDPSGQQQLSLDDVTEEHAVRILVPEKDQAGQSWTLLLEPEATVPGEEGSGKADVTSVTRETSHRSKRRATRVRFPAPGDEIRPEGRCAYGADDSAAPGNEQDSRQAERRPDVRGAVSGDQPVSTAHSVTPSSGKEAEKTTGRRGRIAQNSGKEKRSGETDRAERAEEDALSDARGDALLPSLPRESPSPSRHRTVPPAEAPTDPSIPQCLSGACAEAGEIHTKTANVTPSMREVEREGREGGQGGGRGRGTKGEKGGRRERRREEEERSGGEERRGAQVRQQKGEMEERREKGRRRERGLHKGVKEEEDEREEEEEGVALKEKGAPSTSSVRERERKTKEEDKRGTKEGAGVSKTQRAGGRKGGKAGVKGRAEFVVGKPRPKQEVGHPEQEVEKSERKSPKEDEEKQREEEEELQLRRGNIGGRSVSSPQGSFSSSRSQHSGDGSAPVSRGQSSQQASFVAEEAPPTSPPPMSLHQLTSRSASTVTDSYVTKLSQSEDGTQVNNSRSAEEAARQRERQAAARAEKAERRRQEVERKRREREDEKRRQVEKEEREERMRLELEEEQRQRAEEARLKREQDEVEKQRKESEEEERRRREEAEREREKRRQEEKKRQIERLQHLRQEEERRRAEEQERVRVEEEQRCAEERRRLQEMEESERREYLQRVQQQEEERRRAEEERRRREEEALLWAKEQARLQAQLQARQRALLEQRLSFQRGLLLEAGGLGQTQDISRPWVFSYFTLLELLGLSDPTSSPEGPGKSTRLDSPQLTPT